MWWQCLPAFFATEETLKQCYISQGTPIYVNVYRPEKFDSGEPFYDHRWGASVTIQLTIALNTNWPEQKKKRHLVGHEDYSSIANCRPNIHRDISRDILNFSHYFRLFFSRLLAEPLKMFCGILVGKHCITISDVKCITY